MIARDDRAPPEPEAQPAPAPLPAPTPELSVAPKGPSPRRRRRRALRRVRTRPWLSAVALLLTAAVAATGAGLAVAGANRISKSTGGKTIVLPPPPKQLPSTPVALLLLRDATRVTGAVAVSLRAPRPGGFLIPIPLETVLERLDPESPLAAAFARSTDEGVRAIEVMLRVSFARVETMDAVHLGTLLEPYGPFSMQLADAVFETDAPARSAPLFPAGQLRLNGADAATFLTVVGRGENEIVRRDRVNALWRVVANRATPTVGSSASSFGVTGSTAAPAPATAPVTAPVTSSPNGVDTVPATVAGFWETAFRGALVMAPLPVTIRTDASAPFALAEGAARYLVARAMPSAVTANDNVSRIWLINGAGSEHAGIDLAGRIAFLGDDLVLVTDSPTVVENTVIEYAADHNASRARDAREFETEVGTIVSNPSERVEGIDLKITIGRDYATRIIERERQAEPAATTTTVGPTTVKPGPRPTTTIRPTTTRR